MTTTRNCVADTRNQPSREVIFVDSNGELENASESNINQHQPENDGDKVNDECPHSSTVEEEGYTICVECGLQFDKPLNYEREWRFYGSEDNRRGTNPSRCHLRKSDDRTLFADVEHCQFPPMVIDQANRYYQLITENKIYRGARRKELVFGCIFVAFKECGNPRKPEAISRMMGLNSKEKKIMSRGIKIFAENIPRGVVSQVTGYTTPIDLVPDILTALRAEKEHLCEIKNIFNRVHNRSRLLNRSNPQSTAAGLVYYYCKLIGKNISRKEFSEITELSEITIIKIAREIHDLVGWSENKVSL